MTPEQFLERNPTWREDAKAVCRGALSMIMEEIGVPMDDEALASIERMATNSTIEIFQPHRNQMGDAIFGELVLLVGEEARRIALLARQERLH